MMPLYVILPHQFGQEGPFWCDVYHIEADGTLGLILFSSAVMPTRSEAVRLGQLWIEQRQQMTRLLTVA